jgi:hypothetical protein
LQDRDGNLDKVININQSNNKSAGISNTKYQITVAESTVSVIYTNTNIVIGSPI